MLPPRGPSEDVTVCAAAVSEPLDGVIVPFIKLHFLLEELILILTVQTQENVQLALFVYSTFTRCFTSWCNRQKIMFSVSLAVNQSTVLQFTRFIYNILKYLRKNKSLLHNIPCSALLHSHTIKCVHWSWALTGPVWAHVFTHVSLSRKHLCKLLNIPTRKMLSYTQVTHTQPTLQTHSTQENV